MTFVLFALGERESLSAASAGGLLGDRIDPIGG